MTTLAREFHDAFTIPVASAPCLPVDRVDLRLELLEEEVRELREAVTACDLVAVLDALTDIQYVLDGTYLEFGLHRLKAAALAEVHRSNMTKLGANGKPVLREDGKVLKGPNYSPPDLSRLIRALQL